MIATVDARVVEMHFTVGGDIADFGDKEYANLESAMREQTGCQEPTCILKLILTAGSVDVTAEMIIPSAIAEGSAILSHVLTAAQNLATQPPAALSAVLSVTIESVSPTVASTSKSVPVVVPVPAPPSIPSPSPPHPPLHEHCACDTTVNGAENMHDAICVKVTAGQRVCYPLFGGPHASCEGGASQCSFSAPPCQDTLGKWARRKCAKKARKNKCRKRKVQRHCPATCGQC